MKKILILGGTPQQIKLVNAANRMGYYTIVCDYLKDSPAKKIADKSYMFDIKDVDRIVEMCQKENVEGVICGYIDPCQRPYQEICERLKLPCYGTKEQFYLMTDKHAFKKMCKENNVDTIKEYTEEDLKKHQIDYPVFVKPVDSRGSRGQSVCYSGKELLDAIKFAKDESSNGDILIEKYMKGAHEFQVTYFFIEGEAYLIRTVDSYCGLEEDKMEKVVACAVSPSKYTELYLTNAHENVVKMFKSMGFKNGPIFMQGFEDHGRFRFFDPGLRFPGVDYENIYKSVFNIDIMEAMVNFAMNGNCANIRLPKNGFLLNGKRAAVLFPTLSAGNIKSISGFEEVSCDQSVVSILPRCVEGEKIAWTYNVNQRMAEVDLLSENTVELKHKIDEIQHKLIVLDTNGANMNYRYFDVERIDN